MVIERSYSIQSYSPMVVTSTVAAFEVAEFEITASMAFEALVTKIRSHLRWLT